MQVVAYLEFLKKHASPLPSQQSMACILATFIMQRKMLTASLLSGPSTLPSAFVSACVESKSHSNIVDLILESLCEALETGTHPDSVTDEAASHSHMVTLASPQNLGNEQVVRRVNLQKVVVDASLKVLSLLALKHSDVDEEKQGFSRLLSILFPDTQFSVAWLEGRKGEKLPLLSEDQALLFARCNVAKLIRAGEYYTRCSFFFFWIPCSRVRRLLVQSSHVCHMLIPSGSCNERFPGLMHHIFHLDIWNSSFLAALIIFECY